MLQMMQELDSQLLLFFNGLHTPFLDSFFYWMSNKWIWIPLYAYLFFLFYKNYSGKIVYVVLAVTLLVFLSDQTASTILKNWVMRLRPCHNPELADKIHLVNGYCGGMYGFVSSHA